MNKQEANIGVLASPAAPSGLDRSGLEPSITSELVDLANNAHNIALFTLVHEKLAKFADFKGKEGSRIKKTTLELVGGIALIASAAACSSDRRCKSAQSDSQIGGRNRERS